MERREGQGPASRFKSGAGGQYPAVIAGAADKGQPQGKGINSGKGHGEVGVAGDRCLAPEAQPARPKITIHHIYGGREGAGGGKDQLGVVSVQ